MQQPFDSTQSLDDLIDLADICNAASKRASTEAAGDAEWDAAYARAIHALGCVFVPKLAEQGKLPDWQMNSVWAPQPRSTAGHYPYPSLIMRKQA